MAKGYSQRPGFDFTETFAPTVRYSAVRTILALAALEDMEVHSLDISNAYLNGVLELGPFSQLAPPPLALVLALGFMLVGQRIS